MFRAKILRWAEYTSTPRKQFKKRISVTVPARIYNFRKKELTQIKISLL
jgi:hypothetical protein